MELPPKWYRKHPRIWGTVAVLLIGGSLWGAYVSKEPVLPTIASWFLTIGFAVSLNWIPFVVVPLCLGLLVLIWINTIKRSAIDETKRVQADLESQQEKALTDFKSELARQAEINRQVILTQRYGATVPRPLPTMEGLSVRFESTNELLTIILVNTTAEPLKMLGFSITKWQLWSPNTRRFNSYSDLHAPIPLMRDVTLEPETPKRIPFITANKNRVFILSHNANRASTPVEKFGISKFELTFGAEQGIFITDVFVNLEQSVELVDNPALRK